MCFLQPLKQFFFLFLQLLNQSGEDSVLVADLIDFFDQILAQFPSRLIPFMEH